MADSFESIGTSKEELDILLSKAKTKMFFSDNSVQKNIIFLSTIMSFTSFEWDFSIPTANTNGLEIRFNPVFFLNLDMDGRILVLVHELWHIALNHPERLFTFTDRERANIAADHVINLMMEEVGFDFSNLTKVAKDKKYKNMSTEEVYHSLPPTPTIPTMSLSGSFVPPTPPGQGLNTPTSTGSPVSDPLGNDLSPPPNTDGKIDAQTASDLMTKVVQAYQTAKMSKSEGNLPGEITLLIDQFLNPVLPWEQLLYRFFTDLSQDDYSWARPRRGHEDIYLPSLYANQRLTSINYYVDVSGSISDNEIIRFNSELKYIKEEFNPEFLHVILFDRKISKIITLTENDSFDKIDVVGRGGTSLVPVRKHILDTRPQVAIIFSDLHVTSMQPVGDIPVIWICSGNPNATVPFGTLMHIDLD